MAAEATTVGPTVYCLNLIAGASAAGFDSGDDDGGADGRHVHVHVVGGLHFPPRLPSLLRRTSGLCPVSRAASSDREHSASASVFRQPHHP